MSWNRTDELLVKITLAPLFEGKIKLYLLQRIERHWNVFLNSLLWCLDFPKMFCFPFTHLFSRFVDYILNVAHKEQRGLGLKSLSWKWHYQLVGNSDIQYLLSSGPDLTHTEAYGIAASDFSDVLDDILILKCRDAPVLMTVTCGNNLNIEEPWVFA